MIECGVLNLNFDLRRRGDGEMERRGVGAECQTNHSTIQSSPFPVVSSFPHTLVQLFPPRLSTSAGEKNSELSTSRYASLYRDLRFAPTELRTPRYRIAATIMTPVNPISTARIAASTLLITDRHPLIPQAHEISAGLV